MERESFTSILPINKYPSDELCNDSTITWNLTFLYFNSIMKHTQHTPINKQKRLYTFHIQKKRSALKAIRI